MGLPQAFHGNGVKWTRYHHAPLSFWTLIIPLKILNNDPGPGLGSPKTEASSKTKDKMALLSKGRKDGKIDWVLVMHTVLYIMKVNSTNFFPGTLDMSVLGPHLSYESQRCLDWGYEVVGMEKSPFLSSPWRIWTLLLFVAPHFSLVSSVPQRTIL